MNPAWLVPIVLFTHLFGFAFGWMAGKKERQHDLRGQNDKLRHWCGRAERLIQVEMSHRCSGTLGTTLSEWHMLLEEKP